MQEIKLIPAMAVFCILSLVGSIIMVGLVTFLWGFWKDKSVKKGFSFLIYWIKYAICLFIKGFNPFKKMED